MQEHTSGHCKGRAQGGLRAGNGASSAAQVFKICLDYWNFFVPDVYASVTTGMADANAPFAFAGAPIAPGAATGGRKALYREVLSRLRLLMITRMAKPEEVWLSPATFSIG